MGPKYLCTGRNGRNTPPLSTRTFGEKTVGGTLAKDSSQPTGSRSHCLQGDEPDLNHGAKLIADRPVLPAEVEAMAKQLCDDRISLRLIALRLKRLSNECDTAAVILRRWQQLSSVREKAIEALRPFAEALDRMVPEADPDTYQLILSEIWDSQSICTVGDLRRAAEALAALIAAGGSE